MVQREFGLNGFCGGGPDEGLGVPVGGGAAVVSIDEKSQIPVAGSVVVMDALGICEANFVNWYLSQIIEVAKPGAWPTRSRQETAHADA
jgi:hypothetical protein